MENIQEVLGSSDVIMAATFPAVQLTTGPDTYLIEDFDPGVFVFPSDVASISLIEGGEHSSVF